MILDIRTPEEFAQGHVEGAILVPTPLPPLNKDQLYTLRTQLRRVTKNLPKTAPIWVYCKKGKRASIAVHFLRSLGFDARNLGGVEAEPLPGLVRAGKLPFVG